MHKGQSLYDLRFGNRIGNRHLSLFFLVYFTTFCFCRPNRPAKLRAWTEEQMAEALKAVRQHQMSVRAAAVHYEVPRSTLADR